MADYSQRLLVEKLGIKPGMKAAVLRAPEGYLDWLPELVEQTQLSTRLVGGFDFVQYFARSREQLEAVLPNLKLHLKPDGMLWLSWAKQTSSLHTGLNENHVRELGLRMGLVDVKVAALTSDWSGLKFVYRVSDRS